MAPWSVVAGRLGAAAGAISASAMVVKCRQKGRDERVSTRAQERQITVSTGSCASLNITQARAAKKAPNGTH